jgi:stage II sporulation protein D
VPPAAHPMLRRPLVLALAAALVTAGPAAGAGSQAARLRSSVCTASCYAAPAGSGALFLFSGHGWGHGVGMSQWGAYGFAQHGATYDQILQHYYPGTALGQAPLTTIRVLLAQGRKTLAIASDAPYTVVDGLGTTHALQAGTVRFGPGLALPVDGDPAPQPLAPPLTFVPAAGSPLTLGRAYRGRILVDVVGGKLRTIDVLGLEQYLYGVVPAEMPSTWAPEALKAQAVAARSYALATRQVAAPFDVYGDTRSQVYRGVAAETAAGDAAVDATAGQVLTYAGAVATTFFSSTSGGRTESAADVFGGESLPYLVSVPDPYDTISPYHDWGPVPVTALRIARALKVPGRIVDATTTANAAGRVGSLDVLSLQGASATPSDTPVAGTVARTRLGLRSTWFDVAVLSLAPLPATTRVPYGSTITLSGLVRGIDGVTVEARTSRTPWQEVGPATPGAGGAVTITAQPQITTDYRLVTPTAAAAYVRVRVTPRVALSAPQSPTAIAGTERPVLPGAPVLVQQQNPAGAPAWRTIARGAADESGSFSVPVQLGPGTYRAVVAPGHGFWPGATTPVTVTG